MASSEYSPQKRPASTEAASPIKGYSDDEARDIYARAAEIQSQTAFEDDRLTPEMLERSANRAGISDAAVQQAIRERERDRLAALELEKSRAAQKSRLQRQLMIGALGFALISGGTLLLTQSSLGGRAAKVEASQAQIQNVLQRRHDLVPNLVSVTKSTLENERALIEKLNAANAATQNAGSGQAKQQAEDQLGTVMSQTLSTLKNGAGGASPIVLRLSDEWSGSENRIAQERRKYNLVAAEYNRAASSFPANFARRLLGYRARYDYFQASPGATETPTFK